MSNNLKKWLAERKDRIEEEVQKGKERKGIVELPDGTYIAQYVVHEFGESSNENVGLKSCLKVLEGDCAGETIWVWEDLNRDNAFEWLTIRFKNSGVDVEDAQDIYDQLAKNPTDVFNLVTNDTVVKIVLKSKEGRDGNLYQNKNIVKHLPNYEIEESDEPGIKLTGKPDKYLSGKDRPSEQNPRDIQGSGEAEDSEELAVGMWVTFKKGKKILEGEVLDLFPGDEIVIVKSADDKVHEVEVTAITEILEDKFM